MSTKTIIPNLEREWQQLRDFARLDADWDSYGAERISDASIEAAKQLITRMAAWHHVRPFDMYPLNNGGVQVEWRGDETLLAVEIRADTPLRYLLVDESRGARQPVEEDNATINDVLRVAMKIVK